MNTSYPLGFSFATSFLYLQKVFLRAEFAPIKKRERERMVRLPYTLSCGHSTADMCECHQQRYMEDSPIQKALAAFYGVWRETLESYGLELGTKGRGCPCPICGGTDRFVFDDKRGQGNWLCRHCGAGGGLLLLSRWLGRTTHETATLLLTGEIPDTSMARARLQKRADREDKSRREAQKMAAFLVNTKTTMYDHPYLRRKGLSGIACDAVGVPMRGSDGVQYEAGSILMVPVMRDGTAINVQTINDSCTKKFIYDGEVAGGSYTLQGDDSKQVVAICEGFATALTVRMVTGLTCVVAFSAGNLVHVAPIIESEHPSKRVVIFADHDESGAGSEYAKKATALLDQSKKPAVVIPGELGDWDDYRQAHGVDSTLQHMREQLKREDT